MGYGSYSAAVAEVSVGKDGKVKVHRMVLALNCGHAVNPDQIAAQVEGSVAYGLSAALYGECTVDKGRIVETNFHTYPILRLAEMPKVETVIVPTFDFWGGVGEPTICVVTPAVLNAIFAATGKPCATFRCKQSHGDAGEGMSAAARGCARARMATAQRGDRRLRMRGRRPTPAYRVVADGIPSRSRAGAATRRAGARWSSRATRRIACCAMRCRILRCASRATSGRRSRASARA